MDYLALPSIGLLSIGLLSIDSSVLKLRKLCAELIPRFDLFTMPAAGLTTAPPKSEDANPRKRPKVLQVADEHAGNRSTPEAAESRAARNSIPKDTTSCWNSLLCSRCGKFLVNHRKSVRRGLCCNKCPNHGPWCTSNANLAASSLLDGCEDLPPAVPSSYRRGTQSDRMLIAKDLLAGRYHGSWSMRAEEDGEGEA